MQSEQDQEKLKAFVDGWEVTFEPIDLTKEIEFEEVFNEEKQVWSIIEKDEDPLRPGAVLKLESGKYYLVGDVNESLGTCDHCRFDIRDKVVGVAYLY